MTQGRNQGERPMLVLSRNPGEVIVIGEEIEVKVLDIRGDTARIGIEAPREIRIQRVGAPGRSARTETARTPHDPERGS